MLLVFWTIECIKEIRQIEEMDQKITQMEIRDHPQESESNLWQEKGDIANVDSSRNSFFLEIGGKR